jgi:hypothetical protein
VIRNLLDAVAAQASAAGERIRLAAKVNETSEQSGAVREIEQNDDARAALHGEVDVLGGTAWLWSGKSSPAAWTCCSWMRPARCRWPTRSPSPRQLTTQLSPPGESFTRDDVPPHTQNVARSAGRAVYRVR